MGKDKPTDYSLPSVKWHKKLKPIEKMTNKEINKIFKRLHNPNNLLYHVGRAYTERKM